MKRFIPSLVTPLLLLASFQVNALPLYQVLMDDVVSSNWAPMHDGIGDLYDGGGVKQVEVTYTERADFGNTAVVGADPQFWESPEYGNNHKAIFANQGGSDVLEIEISGLNGTTFELTQVVVGRWYPDGIDTLASEWKVYDEAWSVLAEGSTTMTDFVDYFLDFDFGIHDTVRFQLGHDNWDNGVIAFSYEADVDNGVLDLLRDNQSAPTPNIIPSAPLTSVPEPTAVLLMLSGLVGLFSVRRHRA